MLSRSQDDGKDIVNETASDDDERVRLSPKTPKVSLNYQKRASPNIV